MREPQCSAEVRRRLARHGVPPNRIARVAGELAEHWEELRATALDNGLSAAEAEVEADSRLGEPARLAAETITACGDDIVGSLLRQCDPGGCMAVLAKLDRRAGDSLDSRHLQLVCFDGG